MTACKHETARRMGRGKGAYLHCPACGNDYDYPTPNVNRDALARMTEQAEALGLYEEDETR